MEVEAKAREIAQKPVDAGKDNGDGGGGQNIFLKSGN